MNKNTKVLFALMMAILIMISAAGCSAGGGGEKEEAPDPGIEDGTYVVTFKSNHAMFHVSDANNDKGILTVKDGKMTVHVSLQSKKIINLFYGNKEDAQKDGAELIEPTEDTVYYDDGTTAEVYGFDVPVPALDEEFDVSILGTHGNWYTHKVVVSDPVPGDDIHAGSEMDLEDGEYEAELTLEGGTGRASVESPAKLVVEDGKATLTVIWSSPYYTYMKVGGKEYDPVNEDGNSTFEIPVTKLNEPFEVIGNSTAMSEPHEIAYKLTVSVKE
ncbi:MAG: iron transporter [Eubacterium sp.]|nr:iron transporter [Eubacterium sp.]